MRVEMSSRASQGPTYFISRPNEGLRQGTQVLKQIHKEMGGLEAVEKLMGETEEARAYQQVRFIPRHYIMNL